MEEYTTRQENGQEKEDLKTKTARLKDNVTDYVKTYVELSKAKATRGASNAVSGIVIGVAALVLGLFFLSFLFTGLAW
jgi:F0F1-type ATP synthase assembly protein I